MSPEQTEAQVDAIDALTDSWLPRVVSNQWPGGITQFRAACQVALRPLIAELHWEVGQDKLALFLRLKNEEAKAMNRETAGCRACRERIAELEADKARMGWLESRKYACFGISHYDGQWLFQIETGGYAERGATLRAAIDAAMKPEGR